MPSTARALRTTLALYRVLDAEGDARVDPASPDRYDVERNARPATQLAQLLAKLALTPGFRGALLMGSSDGAGSMILYRFEHQSDFDVFRNGEPAIAMLGPIGASGGSNAAVHPVKTFGAIA